MEIKAVKLGRRFNRDWIFRQVDFHFLSGRSYAILGPNGSGKSTFLQLISASLSPSEGKLEYLLDSSSLAPEDVFRHLVLAAPYLDLIEEFTLAESIRFHFRFKQYAPGMDEEELVRLLGFERIRDRQVRYFSSGMKQRLKLALAVCSDTPLLLLDEPTTNFDPQGISWYRSLIERFAGGRTVLVASNQPHEYEYCSEQLHISDFKPLPGGKRR